MDLPDEFCWGEHLGRTTLYDRRQRLADYHDGRDCWVVCIGLHRMAYALRKVELPNRVRAIHYVEAWARRWDAELRESARWSRGRRGWKSNESTASRRS